MAPETPEPEVLHEDPQQLAQDRRTAARCLGAVVFGAALVIVGTADRRRDNRNRWNCQTNLKVIGLAISTYCRDYDELMPRAVNWTDALRVYHPRDEATFQCPARGSLPQGYALHRYAASMNYAHWERQSSEVVFLFESTNSRRNTSDTGSSLVVEGRHLEGNNYGFGDGHVKWFKKIDLGHGYRGSFYKVRARELARQSLSAAAGRTSADVARAATKQVSPSPKQ